MNDQPSTERQKSRPPMMVQFEIMKILETAAHTELMGPDGERICIYHPGWNDEKVLQEAQKVAREKHNYTAELTPWNVTRARLEMHGKLPPRQAAKGMAGEDTLNAIAELEQQVRDLTSRMEAFERTNAAEHDMMNRAINGLRRGEAQSTTEELPD